MGTAFLHRIPSVPNSRDRKKLGVKDRTVNSRFSINVMGPKSWIPSRSVARKKKKKRKTATF